MQESAVENPYGLGALIQNGDIIARSILLILLIMSLLTWFIMITKFFDQRRQRKQAIETEHRALVSTIDKAVKRGALHRNTGARKKSRAARVAAGKSS